jgi:hypothetical protein
MRLVVVLLGVVVSLSGGRMVQEAAAQPAAPAAASAEPQPPAFHHDEPHAPPVSAYISRWLDAQTFTLTARYRFVDAASTGPDANHIQTNEILRLRVKADRAGRVGVGLGASTGPSFTGGWNDTGIGTGNHRFHVNLRLLSLDLAPMAGVSGQVGSLQLARGESTEITTFDNDGYMTGERLTVRRPKLLFFDEVTVSRGFVGDTTKPSVFDRLDRFHDFNYQQYLLARRVSPRVWTSADVTHLAHANTLHAAARVRAPELHIVDTVRYEQYVRFGAASDAHTIAGFAMSGEKQISKLITAGLGYADVDKQFGGLNADRFNRGRRLFGTFSYALSPVLALTTFIGRAIHNDYVVANRTRVDVALQYNLLAHLQRGGLLR